MKMLMSLDYLLNRKLSLLLQFLDWGVPLLSLLLKLAISRSAMPLFHNIPSAVFDGYFDLMMLD